MSDLFDSPDHATELSAEEKLALIPSVSTRAELNQVERLNINEARTWAMKRSVLRRGDLVTDGFGRELHRRMFRRVWKWSGIYRATEKILGWDVPRLTEGVHNAFADARAWLEFGTYPVEEVAVRLHHRLVVIYPWPNGNGRHARLVADVIVAARGGAELSWGARADLVAAGEVRRRYIEAVRLADRGEYAALLAFARS